jgi:short-subunit dehydrogenase
MGNPFAVITGASSGIGLELAKQFGSHGYDILIVSGSDEIFEAQEELEDLGFTVEAIKANLATYAGVENLYEQISTMGRPVDAIAINAGTFVTGSFFESDLREEINLINMNIISVVHFTKRIILDMKQRGSGKILFNSTFTSQMITPNQAVYLATKAFIASFADSLRQELKETKISITVLMPGAQAKHGYEALVAGKDRVYSENFLSKIQDYALKVLPKNVSSSIAGKPKEEGLM